MLTELKTQPLYLPLNEGYNRSLQKEIYSNQNHFHTSFRPYFILDIEKAGINYDSISQLLRIDKDFNKKWKQKTWDKVFNDDVATFIRDDYSIIANPLMDFTIGNAGDDGKTTWTNTRGLELKGRIGDNFGYYTSVYENQAIYTEYVDTFIRKNNIIPGQGMVHTYLDNGGFDFNSATGYITYQASKYFNFQFGHGKNFYGDGYRSLLLSDNSFNNLFFKATADFWHIKYQVLYNQYIDIRENIPEIGYARKYTTTHYLSWAVSKRVNLSFFDAVVWSATDSAGNYRGFDLQYLNPIIFMRPVEFSTGSPDNALMGLNLSVIVGKHNVLYGQLILDEFKIKHEDQIVSAHRTPARLSEYAEHAEKMGFKLIIAGAGGAAHLPGMIASHTTIPVIGVPILVYNDKHPKKNRHIKILCIWWIGFITIHY